ncbi:hypothetical protein EOD41_16535 [Mucilaginibacter limnophilus]|uniref:Uncharacterized protein n=1 Tax=Mucilaginibacter limnophilus TaxID=1932778 RepID=A0A437ML62_9SPHI|nr:hypothetical protein [Mucilaginibacter limnophilus]RVT98400.1 hypothetical protein EOD41_16535 [Mucilaginibacter limnophilus]
MKRILTFVLFIGVAMVASSCKKEITQVVQPNITIFRDVRTSDWVLNNTTTNPGTTNTWSVDLDIPELDDYTSENGAVLVYIAEPGGQWQQIPQVYNGQSFSFYHSAGGITIDAQAFDGDSPALDNPGALDVKVVLVDSMP